MSTPKSRFTKFVILAFLFAILAGCAANQAYRQAQKASRRENWDQAVLLYSKALALDPGNARFSVSLERAKLKASAQHFQKGKRYAASNQWELAVAEYQQTLLLHPGNQHASNELQRALVRVKRRTNGRSDIDIEKDEARRLTEEMGPPLLDPDHDIAILLQFRDAEVGDIFEAIGKASGINFIFDEKVDLERPMTVDLGSVTLEQALEILMLQTKNFYKIVDENTMLIAPDTRPKRQEYEDQVIRTFYLSNGDTKQVVTLLRSLLQSRQIAENPDLNSVTIKDTPDKVAIADRIISSNDKSKGEVLIDVELLEINRNTLQNLGLDLTDKALSMTFQGGGASLALNNLSVLKQQGNWSIGPIPGVVLDFLKTDSETRSIAKPQLRVTEGEKAEILIGDRVPIPTTSFNTSQTVGGNIVPITSFTYQNVGITVQIEPRVHHNQEVTLNVSVEISQVTGSVEGSGGQAQPIIGTRQITTVIRLRDGETNVLAGLIKRDNSDSKSGVPGLIDIPGLNKVFANNTTQFAETDIILTLTPQIIRMPDITAEDLATLWVGTEENMRLRGPRTGPFGVSVFRNTDEGGSGSGGGSTDAAEEVAATAADAGQDDTDRGGSISRTTSSDEVRRDREERAREQVSQDASDGGGRPTPRSTPGGGVPQGGGDRPPTDDADDPSDPAADDDQPSGPAVVRLAPTATSFGVGDIVTVQVLIENAWNVGSVPFHLRYDRNVVEFIPPGIEGGLLNRDGVNTVFLANDTAAGGEIVVGYSRMGGGQGITGGGIVATFQFQAINPGDCAFQFTGASVKDPQARNLPAQFIPAAVAVTE